MTDRAVIDKHAGWTCDTGASLIANANSPGKGSLPDLNAVIYVCPDHQADAEARITAAGYDAVTEPSPAGHKWDPWPCGHITAFRTEAADRLARARVEHPSWCSREFCTAPEFRPTNEEYKGAAKMGAHRSAMVSGPVGDLVFNLWQGVCPWDTDVFLEISSGETPLGTVGLNASGGGFELFELLGQPLADLTRAYPALYGERFGYIADAMDRQADEATADASMPRDPVELEERMAAEFLADEDDQEPTEVAPARKLTDLSAEELVRHVAHLADSVVRRDVPGHADELAAAAKLLQYRYDAPAWQGRNGTKPDSGIPAVDLMRRVRWEGNGFLAVSAGEIRRTYGAGPEPLAQQLAGHNLLTLPHELPADDDTRVLLYTGLSQIGSLLTATEEDGEAVIEANLVEAVRNSRLPHPHPMDF